MRDSLTRNTAGKDADVGVGGGRTQRPLVPAGVLQGEDLVVLARRGAYIGPSVSNPSMPRAYISLSVSIFWTSRVFTHIGPLVWTVLADSSERN